MSAYIKGLLRLKTSGPMILTARIASHELELFERLRRENFPTDRNFLNAHLTMFHRLPGEYLERIVDILESIAQRTPPIVAEVSGVRHLGAGVAFSIQSTQLQTIRAELRSAFSQWIGGQDMQKWQAHVTVQNKVARQLADQLYEKLSRDFKPGYINITGLDLWRYLGGPWEHRTTALFCAEQAGSDTFML